MSTTPSPSIKRPEGRPAVLPALAQLPALSAGPARRLHGLWMWLLAMVGIPTLAAAVYYGLVASDVYISEAKFTIRGDAPVPSSGLELALFGAGGGEDALVVRAYIFSHAIVAELDRELGLREAFGRDTVDPLQRLDPDVSHEDLVLYFEDMVEVVFDPDSQVTTLQVRAFDPADARRIAEAILRLGERLVNALSERVTEDLLGFARAELVRTEQRVAAASRALTSYRDQTAALDPTREAGSILGIITGLEERLAEERAELMQLRSFLREDSARVAAAKARISALEAQIGEERARLTGGDQRLSQVVATYEDLQLELEFARNAYTTMLASLEAARAEAQKQQKYLIAVVAPNLPEEPLEPRRLLGVLTVSLGALLSFGIGALIVAAVREHLEL